MASILSFIFLVVVPIWGVTMIVTRWLEHLGDRLDEDAALAGLRSSEAEITARIEALEAVLAQDKAGQDRQLKGGYPKPQGLRS